MEIMMILKIAGFIALGIAAFLVATYLVMRLWNWLIPTVFNGPRLRYIQALGLVFLTRLLVGFGGPSHGGPSHGGPWGSHWNKQHTGTHCEQHTKPQTTNLKLQTN